MADFNQSPSGQASVDLATLITQMDLTGSSVAVGGSFSPIAFSGATSSIDFSSVEAEDLSIYPGYRRPIRLIASAPAT